MGTFRLRWCVYNGVDVIDYGRSKLLVKSSKSLAKQGIIWLCHVAEINAEYCMQVQNQGDQKMVSPGSDRSDIKNIEAGNLSNENAERRANTPVNEQPFTSIQAFDGVGEC